MAAMTELGLRLIKFIALALHLPADYFSENFVKPMVFLRPLHYNAEKSDPSNGIFGAGMLAVFACNCSGAILPKPC